MEWALMLVALAHWLPVRAQDRVGSDRHAVYWNSSNPRFLREEYRVSLSINDYLDIYCPFYEEPLPRDFMENYILFMVSYDGYVTCDHRMRGLKRWECNQPHSANGPLKFSEKFQLFTPFSLGFEFRPGNEYYYISSPHPLHPDRTCLRLKVYVKLINESKYESPEPFFTDSTSTYQVASSLFQGLVLLWMGLACP